MNAIPACRALLCGLTLLAGAAMAMPDATPPQTTSPCLSQPPAAKPPPPAAPPKPQWRGPCYLADADKADDDYENDADAARQARQRADDIMSLTRSSASGAEEHPLAWQPPLALAHPADAPPTTVTGPGSWMAPANPMAGAETGAAPHHNEGGIPPVPEPGTVFMLIAGLVLIGGAAARHRRPPPFSDDTAPPAARR
ncbi:PEP-CTERM sorting domain-containing protein [Duganella radicis]|uniref:PEP-CTERM sorting domain-containing protein n=1 Tax=Duganella radicis TaxID=551988 RepID=A0A6L6PR60_9BURK|nr:PEP-CTERM sorting domain-containing protein [Duganella radicis]MTV41560.1 PEP-CTERM sorting domain-containing protein [Duganella radicis]